MNRIKHELVIVLIQVSGILFLLSDPFHMVFGQSKKAANSGVSHIALSNVHVVPMDSDTVLFDYTVVTADGRIAVMGPASGVTIPPGAKVIDGKGMYLLPGLIDAHVHLDKYVGARPMFGDAPMYLYYGVTSVINLRGDKEHLVWKKQIADGSLIAPNLYTSGEFVNEPRITTADEAEQEILNQKNDGYDVIKFREVIDFEKGRIATTTGMERDAYLHLIRTARQHKMPIVGHAPYRVGLDGLLEGGQSLAHTNELANLFFLAPLDFISDGSLFTALCLLTVLILYIVVFSIAMMLLKFMKKKSVTVYATYYKWMLLLFFFLIICSVLWMITVSAGVAFGNVGLLLLLSVLIVLSLLIITKLGLLLVRDFKATSGFLAGKILLSVFLILLIVYTSILAWWTPFAWRSSEWVIRSIAKDMRLAGIYVQSTLVLYETGIGRSDGYQIHQLINDPMFACLPKPLQEGWKGIPGFLPGWVTYLWQRHPDFTRHLLRVMHEEGVPVMAGTDAMGVPLVLPGSSLHKELALLKKSGLSNYEVIRAATVIPARFLNREDEFGTVSSGKRADLILVKKNPLEDIGALQQPIGVMVRGTWLERDTIETMLNALK